MEAPCSSGNPDEQFSVTDWAALQSVDLAMKFSGTNGFSSGYNVRNSGIPTTIDRLPSLSCFGSGSLSEIMGSFGLPESAQMGDAVCAQELPTTTDHGTEKNLSKGKKKKKVTDCGVLQSHSPLVSNQNVDAEQQKDVQNESAKTPMEKDEEKTEAGPADYIHVRAKRGQATNSHSLAERVRREKISERMRLLQDLVPGCNKITGKAVMLDEIINYVQSLQKQVEFLSMKLAAVNPEFNLDIEQIFAKESLHSRFLGNSPTLPYCQQQMATALAIPSLPSSRDLLRIATNTQISPMAQIPSAWDAEFQNAIQMGLIPSPPPEAMELNGSSSR